MGLSVMFFIVRTGNVVAWDDKLRHFIQSKRGDAGIMAGFLDWLSSRRSNIKVARWPQQGEFSVYGMTSKREDLFLSLTSDISRHFAQKILAGMILDSAGFDGAWIYDNGILEWGSATDESQYMPLSEISSEPIEEGFLRYHFPLTYRDFHNLVSYEDPVVIC